MRQQGSSTAVDVDPCVVLAQLAAAVAEGAPLRTVLDGLVAGFALTSAVLRSTSGELLGVGGGVLRAVPVSVPAGPSVELPVPGGSAAPRARLTVTGARPSQLSALRTVAAVLALGLSAPASDTELVDDAEAGQDDLADALHDGALQALVVARYATDAAVRGGDPAEARAAVQDALVAVRRHLWHLRPRGADGLVASLELLSAQRVQAGGPPVRLVAETDLQGAAAVTAYRLVQAVTAAADGGQTRVAVRRDGAAVVVDIDVPGGGLPLPSPERWSRRARAHGGDLSTSAGRLRLVLPLTEARTAP